MNASLSAAEVSDSSIPAVGRYRQPRWLRGMYIVFAVIYSAMAADTIVRGTDATTELVFLAFWAVLVVLSWVVPVASVTAQGVWTIRRRVPWTEVDTVESTAEAGGGSGEIQLILRTGRRFSLIGVPANRIPGLRRLAAAAVR